MAHEFDFFAETTRAAQQIFAKSTKDGAGTFTAAAVLAVLRSGMAEQITADSVANVLPGLGRGAAGRTLRTLERLGFLVRSLRLAPEEGQTDSSESDSETETDTPSPVPPFPPFPLPLTTPTPIPPITPLSPTPENVPTPVTPSCESSGVREGAHEDEAADVVGGVVGLAPTNTPSHDNTPTIFDQGQEIEEVEDIPHGDELFSDYGRQLLAEIDAEKAAQNDIAAEIALKTPSEGEITASAAEVVTDITQPQKTAKKDRSTLFANSDLAKLVTYAPDGTADVSALATLLPDLMKQNCDLAYYFVAVRDWSDSSNTRRTARGWLATIRNFFRGDMTKGQAHKVINYEVDPFDPFV